MKILDATKAAANLDWFLGKVHTRRESFAIVKRGVPYAQLIPVRNARCSSHDFADDIAKANLSASERKALGKSLREGRQALKSVRNPWA
jgi:hypothetical protein